MDINRFDQLMQINQAAFAEGHYNTAYHALSAALHCAQDDEDQQKIRLVGETAENQARIIDEHAPDYELSSRSAQLRGYQTDGIYTMLARQTQAAATLMQAGETLERIPFAGAAKPLQFPLL